MPHTPFGGARLFPPEYNRLLEYGKFAWIPTILLVKCNCRAPRKLARRRTEDQRGAIPFDCRPFGFTSNPKAS